MTYRSQAYKEGEDAFDRGKPPTHNPYAGNCWQKLDFDDGWYDRSLRGPPTNVDPDTDDERWSFIGSYIAE